MKAENDHMGLKYLFLCFFLLLLLFLFLFFLFFLSSREVYVFMRPSVCARLHFLGAPLLAHVSMCVRVHLSLCVVTPGPTPHECTLSDL